LAYEIIDEKRFMLEGSTKEEANRVSPVSRMLKKFVVKKEEADSKWIYDVYWIESNITVIVKMTEKSFLFTVFW